MENRWRTWLEIAVLPNGASAPGVLKGGMPGYLQPMVGDPDGEPRLFLPTGREEWAVGLIRLFRAGVLLAVAADMAGMGIWGAAAAGGLGMLGYLDARHNPLIDMPVSRIQDVLAEFGVAAPYPISWAQKWLFGQGRKNALPPLLKSGFELFVKESVWVAAGAMLGLAAIELGMIREGMMVMGAAAAFVLADTVDTGASVISSLLKMYREVKEEEGENVTLLGFTLDALFGGK